MDTGGCISSAFDSTHNRIVSAYLNGAFGRSTMQKATLGDVSLLSQRTTAQRADNPNERQQAGRDGGD